MYNAVFYKEWIKTRKLILLLSVVFSGFITYSFISFGQLLRLAGRVEAWESIIMNDIPLFPHMRWVPLLAAVLMALAQYVPEMYNKRLKLTLHLPLPEGGIIWAMLCHGLVILIIFYGVTYATLLWGLSLSFPTEIVSASFRLSIPWFLAGLAAYLFTAWICLEPVWKQRIISGVVAVCCLSLFFIKAGSGAYDAFMPYLLSLTTVSLLFPLYSVVRFKEGAQ